MLVSERTAKRMVASLLNKLGVTNRIAAAAWPAGCVCSTISRRDDSTDSDCHAGHIAAARTARSRSDSGGSASRTTTWSAPSGRSNSSGAAIRHCPWPSQRV